MLVATSAPHADCLSELGFRVGFLQLRHASGSHRVVNDAVARCQQVPIAAFGIAKESSRQQNTERCLGHIAPIALVRLTRRLACADLAFLRIENLPAAIVNGPCGHQGRQAVMGARFDRRVVGKSPTSRGWG